MPNKRKTKTNALASSRNKINVKNDEENSENETDKSSDKEYDSDDQIDYKKRKLLLDKEMEIKKWKKEDECFEMRRDMERIVIQSYRMRCSKTHAFFNLHRLFIDAKKVTEKKVTQWFEKIENSSDELKIDDHLLKLINLVNDGYLHFKHDIFNSLYLYYFLGTKNLPHYGFSLHSYYGSKLISLDVMDLFHSKEKRFKFTGIELPYHAPFPLYNLFANMYFPYKLHPIDPQHMFILSTPTMTERTAEYSMRILYFACLNYKQKECKILSKTRFYYNRDTEVLQDPQHPSKFVIHNCWLNKGEDETRVQFLDISNSTLNAERTKMIGKHRTICPRFKNDVLDGFCLEFEQIRRRELDRTKLARFSYWSFVQKKFSKSFNFALSELKNFDMVNKSNSHWFYAWFEDECFVMNPSTKHSRKGFKNLYSFNITTQRCTLIFMNFIESDFYFDFDGNLVVENGRQILYYTIKKPQRLEQIVWREIHNQKRFFENKHLYRQAKKQLPKNSQFQPFCF